MKNVKDQMVATLQSKNKELEEQVKMAKKQLEDTKRGEASQEEKIKALNEIHSQKTKALLKSINVLKKEIQKTKHEQKDNVRHQKNERLMEDIKLQEVAINAMRKLVNDEDKCNLAIKRELEKGPTRVRVKSREELKIEIQKYKSISIKIIQDYKRMGQKVPAYANGLAKQVEAGDTGMGEGLKKQKSDAGSRADYDIEFDEQSEASVAQGELPEKAQQKIDKLMEKTNQLNIELKDKNEKIIELLAELEDVKIQVFARDKSIELQQNQIEELLEEMRELKGLENEVKMLDQSKSMLEQENEQLRKALDQRILEEANNKDSSQEQGLIIQTQKEQIQSLKNDLASERALRVQYKRLHGDSKKTAAELNAQKLQLDQEYDMERKKALQQIEEANKKIAERERALAEAEQSRTEDLRKLERHEQKMKEEMDRSVKLQHRTRQLEKLRDDEARAKTQKIAQLERQRDAAIQETAKEKRDMETKMADQLARHSLGVRAGAAGRDASGGKSADVRRQLYEERRKMIEAEDRAEALEIERRSRQELENTERILELSRRSKSRGGSKPRDLDMGSSQRPSANRAVSPQVNIVNLNQQRPQTAVVDPPAQLGQSENKLSARLATSTSREDLRALNKARRAAELRVLDAEQRQEEEELLRKEQAELDAKVRVLDRHRSRSQGRVSDLSSPQKGAGKFEDDDE